VKIAVAAPAHEVYALATHLNRRAGTQLDAVPIDQQSTAGQRVQHGDMTAALTPTTFSPSPPTVEAQASPLSQRRPTDPAAPAPTNQQRSTRRESTHRQHDPSHQHQQAGDAARKRASS